jgi:hypothetical protein
MKAKILLSLIILAIIGSCTQKKPAETTVLGMMTDYALIPNRLNGKVKEIKELNYWAIEKDGKITKGELMSKIDLDSVGSTKNLKAYFNEQGVLTRYEVLDKEDIFQSSVFTIENNKWARVENKYGDSTVYYLIPQYDNSGYLTGATGYRPIVDTIVNKYVLTNDVKGSFTKIESFNSKGQRTSHQDCSVDEKGNVIEVKFYNRADSLTQTMKNIYNEDGSIIRQETLIEKPKSTIIWDYKDLKFDSHSNWIETYANIDNGKYKIFAERTYLYY